MKKVISVLLAALMLMSCFAVGSFATSGECDCGPGEHTDDGVCNCCVYCENRDVSMIMNCCFVNGVVENGKLVTPVPCCDECDGLYPCNCGVKCGCEYCVNGDKDITAGGSTLGDIWSEQDQQNFVDGFQAILKKISDFFDMVFDAIFEFLRIDEVLDASKNNQ